MPDVLDQTERERDLALWGGSSYLRFLPALYSENEFMGRFLMVFESVLQPIEGMVDNIASYLDAATMPAELLPWLASWVDLALDETWPLDRRRNLVRSAILLFQWRGTRYGLREYLRIYTGVTPKIGEDFGGIPIGEQSLLGWNTVLGDGQPFTFTVTLELDESDKVNPQHIRDIIEMQKPAHTAYVLRILPRGPVTQEAATA